MYLASDSTRIQLGNLDVGKRRTIAASEVRRTSWAPPCETCTDLQNHDVRIVFATVIELQSSLICFTHRGHCSPLTGAATMRLPLKDASHPLAGFKVLLSFPATYWYRWWQECTPTSSSSDTLRSHPP